MVKTSFEDAQKSMEDGGDAGENEVAISEPAVSDVATTLNQPQAHPSETGESWWWDRLPGLRSIANI